MKLRPLNDWAVIQRLDAGDTTPGGIIVPDVAKQKPAEGIVVSIGPGRYTVEKKDRKEKGRDKKKVFVPTSVKPGERVIYERYMITEVEIDGKEITLVREENILGTVEGADMPVAKSPKRDLMIPSQPAKTEAKKEASKPAATKPAVPEAKPAKATKKAAGKRLKRTVKKASGGKAAQKKAAVGRSPKKVAKRTAGKVAKKGTKKTTKKGKP